MTGPASVGGGAPRRDEDAAARPDRSDRWQWALLLLALAGIAGWNLWQNHVYRGQVAGLSAEVGALRASVLEAGEKMTAAHEASLGPVGRSLAWPEMERVAGAAGAAAHYDGRRLVMYFSELSCNACRDGEAQFMNGLAGVTGGDGLAIVVHANNPRYARNFIRLNGLTEIPVFIDEAREFGRANGVRDSPMLYLLDAEGEVLAAHFPLPDRPEWTKPFHDLVSRELGLM